VGILTSPRRVPSGAAVIALCLVGAGERAVAQATPEALEYRVKAAYLLNFTRYVEWPPSAFTGPDATLNVCVVGRDPFGEVLDQTIGGRRVAGRSLRVLRPDRPASDLCHVAFVGDAPAAVREAWLAALRTEATLTVGETRSFAQDGGMIAFVIQDETVRFEINVGAVRSGGLRMSSRVLTLATRLYREREGT
jgi:hypothetical protein